MKNTESVLAALGLTVSEIDVYFALLSLSRASIAEVVNQTSHHRPQVMKTLQSLIDKGLVEPKKTGKRVVYIAASPHVLVDQAKAVLQETRAALPELLAKAENKKNTQSIRVLYGEEGIAACFLDVVVSLQKDDVFYRVSSAKDQTYVDSLVPKEYRPLREAKQLERRVITTRQIGEQKKPRLERSIRFIDSKDELFEHNVIQFIYGEKISLLDFNTLTGTIIHNKAVAEFQKSLFLTLYSRLDRE